MLETICDIHCHLLPEIDDGAKDMEESMQALQEAVRQGISTIIATPHFRPDGCSADADTVLAAWKAVRRECQKRGIPVRVLPGQECYYYSGLLDELDKGNVLTLAGSEYVLVEFSVDCTYSALLHGLQELLSGGYHPILAHFERYRCLHEQNRLFSLKNRGILLQMNFDTLLKHSGLFQKNPWRRLAGSGIVDFFGSDCHGVDFRPYHVAESCRWLEKHLDPALLHTILYENIQKILERE